MKMAGLTGVEFVSCYSQIFQCAVWHVSLPSGSPPSKNLANYRCKRDHILDN